MTPNQHSVDIFSLTENGARLASRLLELMPAAKHHHRPKPFVETAQAAFSRGHRCVFICSSAIVVRALAPVLRDKYLDPAVVVMDEHGEYVIPLLCAHEGGAAAFAMEIAEFISARCVMTSATDYSRPIYSLGIGCDRGCPLSMLESLVKCVRAEIPDQMQFSALASIDLKSNEKALLALAEKLDLSLTTFPAKTLRTVEDQLSIRSDIVFKEVGCYGVAEAAALCAASAITGMPAELMVNKQKNTRATISVARSYTLQR